MDFSDPSGALRRYQQSLTGGRSAYDQALAQQLATMQQPVDRRGALMRMAQGFLSPTKTGAFAENAGMAIGGYADANDKMREQEMDRAMKLAQIQAARAKLQMEGAGQDFGIFEKGYGLMQAQNERQAGLDFGNALRSVASGAQAASGGEMPSLPGTSAPLVDMDLFSPNETAPKDRMQRFQPQPSASWPEGASLPTRKTPPTEDAAPVAVPGPRTDLLPSNGMEEFAQSPAPMPGQFGPMGFDENMPIPRDGVQTLRTRNANDQIDARLSPQPQQAAPQQVPQAPRTILGMPRPAGPVAQRAWDTLDLLDRSPEADRLSDAQRAALAKQATEALKDTPEYKRATSERQGRINALRGQGYSDRDATDLVEGVITVQVDPDTGVPYRVNQITGEAERMTVRSPQSDDRELPRPAQSLFERVPGATGALRSAQSLLTETVGQIPIFGQFAQSPEVIADRQAFSLAQKSLVRALQDNPRYAEGERKAIEAEISIQPGAFRSVEGLTARLTEIKSALERRMEIAQRSANNYDLPKDFRQAAAQTAEAVKVFLSELGEPIAAPTGGSKPPTSQSGSGSTSTGTRWRIVE